MVDTPVNVMILHLGHTSNVIWHVTSPMQFYNQLVLDGKGERMLRVISITRQNHRPTSSPHARLPLTKFSPHPKKL